MKHIKSFEKINIGTPEVNDYVLCEELNSDNDITSVINNNIGQITSYSRETRLHKEYYNVKYINKNVSPFIMKVLNQRRMYPEEIKYWSPNIKDLETILQTKKFNI